MPVGEDMQKIQKLAHKLSVQISTDNNSEQQIDDNNFFRIQFNLSALSLYLNHFLRRPGLLG
jgi:hypothetical protein